MPLVVPDKHALVLNLRDPSRVEAVLPHHQRINDHMIAVPHRTKEFMVLKNMGINVDGFEPIATHYDWPPLHGEHPPMPHQRTTAEFLTANPRGFILNEQRTGKTAAAVWATDYLKRDKAVKGILIVSTLSTLRSVWRNEFFSIAPHLSVGVLHGAKKDRIAMLREPFDVYVVNHDGLKVISGELLAAIKSGRINAILIDEMSELSNHEADLFKAAKPICDAAQFCWGMTASPLARGPERAFGMVKLICPDKMPHLYGAWRMMVTTPVTFQVENPRTGRPVMVTKYVPRKDAASLVYGVMQPVVRFAKKDVLKDLPPLTEQELLLTPTEAQKRAISEMRRFKGTVVDGDVLTAANAGVLANKLIQICGGAAKGIDGSVVRFDVSNKTKETMRLIEATNQKVLIFSNYHAVTDLIVETLEKRDIGVVWIDGRVTGRKRDNRVHRFQHDDSIKVLVAHPETTAHGLEFSVADTTIWWTLTTDPEFFLQANERMASAAQKNPMGIYYLFAHPIEQVAYRAMKSDISVQSALFDLIKRMQGEVDSSQFVT